MGKFTKVSDLQILERVLNQALPKSVQLLSICRIACQNAIPDGVDIQFYRYTELEIDPDSSDWWNGNNEHFIVCVQRPNLHTKKGIVLLPPATPTPEMIQAFDNFVGWDESQVFHCVPPTFWPHIEAMCATHKNARSLENYSFPGIMHTILDLEKAKNLQINGLDDNLYVRSVEDGDIAEMLKNWKWKAAHSGVVIRMCIKTLVSCGLFIDKEMASSVVLSPLGLFNILYTPEKHCRKGYGKLVMEWASQQTAERFGVNPIAEVEAWNDASRLLLEKIGYKEVFKTKWFYYDPPQ